MNRYLWEGVVQAAGYDPYEYPPNAGELAPVYAANPELGRRMLATGHTP